MLNKVLAGYKTQSTGETALRRRRSATAGDKQEGDLGNATDARVGGQRPGWQRGSGSQLLLFKAKQWCDSQAFPVIPGML